MQKINHWSELDRSGALSRTRIRQTFTHFRKRLKVLFFFGITNILISRVVDEIIKIQEEYINQVGDSIGEDVGNKISGLYSMMSEIKDGQFDYQKVLNDKFDEFNEKIIDITERMERGDDINKARLEINDDDEPSRQVTLFSGRHVEVEEIIDVIALPSDID